MEAVITPRKPRTATLVLSLAERLQRCATPMSKFTLFSALASNGQLTINGISVTLSSVQREDGSGSSFNLTVYGRDGNTYRSYVKTID